jgi:hypothetical protein
VTHPLGVARKATELDANLDQGKSEAAPGFQVKIDRLMKIPFHSVASFGQG